MPVAVALVAAKVTTVVPAVVPLAKVPVNPLGNPLAASDALPLNPPTEIWVIVSVTLPPLGTLTFGWEADRENPGAVEPASVTAKTTTLRLAGSVRLWTVLELLNANVYA